MTGDVITKINDFYKLELAKEHVLTGSGLFLLIVAVYRSSWRRGSGRTSFPALDRSTSDTTDSHVHLAEAVFSFTSSKW